MVLAFYDSRQSHIAGTDDCAGEGIYKNPLQQINGVYSYRTWKLMKSQAVWVEW